MLYTLFVDTLRLFLILRCRPLASESIISLPLRLVCINGSTTVSLGVLLLGATGWGPVQLPELEPQAKFCLARIIRREPIGHVPFLDTQSERNSP
jgi:hypothetical protein